jgi:GNAT superfamily N-acetyltransferase
MNAIIPATGFDLLRHNFVTKPYIIRIRFLAGTDPQLLSGDMTSAMKIRNAQPEEAKEISALAMRSKAYWGYSEEFMKACRDELTVTAERINSNDLHYMVAEQGSQLLGYYAIEKCAEEGYELEALFVEPAHIGTGVGKALIEHAKNAVLELGGKTLIIQGDPNAERFYRAAGGKLIGMRESASISGRSLPLFIIELASDDLK